MVVESAQQHVESYYTPSRVRRLIEEWPLTCSHAETPTTSAHHYGHAQDDEDDRPCMPTPGHGKGGTPDRHAGSDRKADLERAHASLRFGSFAWTLIDYQMRFGPMGLRELRQMAGRDMNAVCDAYRGAIRQMAQYLGWTPQEHERGREDMIN